MKRIKIFILLSALLFMGGCYDRVPIEKLTLTAGSGYDVDNDFYVNSIEYLLFRGNKTIQKNVISSLGNTLYGNRNDRHLRIPKKTLISNVRIYLIGEQRARIGIKDLLDSYVRDYERSLTPVVAICKGKAEDILRLTPKSNITSSEALEGMIETSADAYFFNKKNKLKDILYMHYQEGRRMIIPYIEQEKDMVKISGLAVFDKDMLIRIIPINEALYVNLIRNHKGKSYLSNMTPIKNQYIDIYGTSKRKVKVSYVDNKIKYDIRVNIKGEIKLDTEHPEVALDKKDIEEVEKSFEQELEKNLKAIIKKAQEEYKIDVFDIEKFSYAKFGHNKLKTLNSSFEEAAIDVKVKVKLTSAGRLLK